MKTSKLMVGLALAGSIGYVTYAYAAGLFPDYPVVGGASYCAGTSNTAIGSIIGSVTGCPNTVPAGPSSVTGNELIPADTRLSSGVTPQTVLMPMAALNALPITVVSATATPSGVSAANNSGGTFYRASSTITSATLTLPQAPIDGQQYVIASNQNITTLNVSANLPSGVSVANSPTTLTTANTAPYNYRFFYSATGSPTGTPIWLRLQ